MSNQPTAKIKSPAARRDDQRAVLGLYGEARQGLAPWTRVRIDDLSPSGFRLTGIANADPHQPMRIRIPGLQLLSGRVCWQKGKQLGCEFALPLHEAVFNHIIGVANA